MSESNVERKSSRTSILKPRKSVSEANESSSDCREVRRVSFASSNFVKPFAADPEKNTIWDNTYEEEVLADSTRSNDHLETAEFLDITTLKVADLQDCNKENYIPIKLCLNQETIKLTDKVPKNELTSLEIDRFTSNLVQNMEITSVLSNVPIVNKNVISSELTKNTSTSKFHSQNMQLTNVVLKGHENPGNNTLGLMEDMSLTCFPSSDVMDITCTNISDNIVEENMELTCGFPSIPQSISKTQYECMKVANKNTNVDLESNMQLTCIVPKADVDEICANKNENDVEEDMEFTCAFTNYLQNNVGLENKEIIKSSEDDMEFTCAFTKYLQADVDLKNKENIEIPGLQKITAQSQPSSKMLHLQKQNTSEVQDIQLTCISTLDKSGPIKISSNDLETSMQFTNVSPESQVINTSVGMDMEFTCSLADIPKSNINSEQMECFTSSKNISANMLHSDKSLNLTETNDQKVVDNLEVTSSAQKEIYSFDIYETSNLTNEQKLKIHSQVRDVNTNKNGANNNFKLNPDIEETSSSSYAIIYPEHSEEKLYTKSPLSTSKVDGKTFIKSTNKLDASRLKDNMSMEMINNSILSSTDTLPNLKVSSEAEFVKVEKIYSQGYTINYCSKNSKILDENLMDTISVEIPNSYSLVVDTSLPDLHDSIDEAAKIDKKCNSINNSNLTKSDSISLLLKQAEEIVNLSQVKVSEFPVTLIQQLDEADRKTCQLLEAFKVIEFEIIDLEELYQVEEEFASSVSRLSDVIISTDSGSNNDREEIGLSDIIVPKTLEELVKEAAARSETYWEFVKCDNNYYCFHIFNGMISFNVKVHPEKGLVDEINVNNNLEEDEVPLLHYLAQYLQNKLKKENLLLPLGVKFDLLTLLDYVVICVEEARQFFIEFNKLENEYGPTHKFRMNTDFSVIVEVMKIKEIIWWVITINISATNLGSIIQVNARQIYEEVDEKHIQSIASNLEAPKYIRNFILCLEEYVQKISKQIAARRENELLDI